MRTDCTTLNKVMTEVADIPLYVGRDNSALITPAISL